MIESTQPVLMHQPLPNHKRPRIFWIWVGYWCFLFVIMHIPITHTLNSPIDNTDKVAHFCLYFILTRLSSQYFLSVGKPLTLGRLSLWVLIFAAYGAVDEWLQPFVGRSMTLGDWLADMGGILASTAWIAFKTRSTTISEPT